MDDDDLRNNAIIILVLETITLAELEGVIVSTIAKDEYELVVNINTFEPLYGISVYSWKFSSGCVYNLWKLGSYR